MISAGRLVPTVLFCALLTPALAFVEREEVHTDARILQPAIAESRGEIVDAAAPTSAAATVREFVALRGGAWTFRVDPRTARPALVLGSGVPMTPGRGNTLDATALAGLPLADGKVTLQTLEPLARAFIAAHADLLEPRHGELRLDHDLSLIRADGRLVTLHFAWSVDDVPVEGAGVFLRFNSGNLTQFGAPLVGDSAPQTQPVFDANRAVTRLMEHSGDAEAYRLVDEPRLLLQPEQDAGGALYYRLVWLVTYRLFERLETWEGRIDALTGEVVGFRDTNHYARVVGGIYPRTVFEGNETVVPFPATTVISNGTQTTDTAGAYAFDGVAASSGLNGRWFNTNCQGCSNPSQPGVVFELGTGRIDFGSGGADHIGNGFSTPADRNAFYHLTQVRRIGRKWLPALNWMNNTMSVNVNIANSCNAFYNGSVNFYRSGGGCNNTGEISDVMQHEWGHGLDLNTRGGDGATGEATADVVAMHMTQSPLVGPGFSINGTPVRNLDPNGPRGPLTTTNISSKCPVVGTLGPLGYQVHCEGEIYGQTAWEFSNALVAKHGYQTGWRQSERIFFTSLPDAGGYLPSSSFSVYAAYLNADDDDGNLANGTPNATEIFNAFAAHGIAGAQVAQSAACSRPAQPALNVVPQCDRFELSWGAVPGAEHYEIFRGELRLQQALFPLGQVDAAQTTFTDSEVAPEMNYWYVVMAVDAAGCESTIESPVPATLLDQPVLSVVSAGVDDVPRGNRSGAADPGEEVDLLLGVANFGNVAATSLGGTLATTTPGVTLIEGAAGWPGVDPGFAATNLDPLRFVTDDAQVMCGDLLDFQFVPDEASGCAAETSYFKVQVGEPFQGLQADFETDAGFVLDVSNSTAMAGNWVRGTPIATTMQPGGGVTGSGSQCWFTGQNAGGDPEFHDLDRGVTILLSPQIDLGAVANARLTYWRWWANSAPGVDPGDYFAVDVSNDDGQNWVNLETLDFTQTAPSWTQRSFDLTDFIAPTSDVRLRFVAADGSGVASLVEAAVDDVAIDGFVCDSTPACFTAPSFSGLDVATGAGVCAETLLSWQPASTNCLNAEITYNIYRSTEPGFTPDPASLIASGLTSTSFVDTLLVPDQSYAYVVRAFDSRSGEDGNLVVRSVVAPSAPDPGPPVFGGLAVADSGADCGEIALSWSAAIESCNAPVSYEIYRGTDPAFVPGPASRIGSALSTLYVDAALQPGVDYTYVVRARDGLGQEEINDVRLTVPASIQDRLVELSDFEPSPDGWSVVEPNDATTGNWEWGDPQGTAQQPEDDATEDGVNAWITGLAATLSGGGNNDIDDGTTTLLSRAYDMSGMVDPVVAYARWFTNDTGASPGEDPLIVDISDDDGASWTLLEQISAGTPLAWVETAIDLPAGLTPTSTMRVRFTASDLGAGSLVEAGVDDFRVIDRGQGCLDCALPVSSVGTIRVEHDGADVVLDWTADPAPGSRFVVYKLTGPTFDVPLRIGSTDTRTFVHEGAVAAAEDFAYRVTAVDSCGNESNLP